MTDAELQALLDAASPGPWHHVNPGMVSPKTRTIHGTVPAEPVDYVSTWPGLGTPSGHRVVIDRNVGVRSADMALIAEAPALAAEVLALRAGSAASAERIKELEARVAELEAALAKANEPRWFYADGEGIAWRSMEEAVEESCDDLEHGRHLVEIETARPCPTIWGVVHVFTKTELEDQHRDGGPFEGKPYNLTVCATEAEARALLKETDQ